MNMSKEIIKISAITGIIIGIVAVIPSLIFYSCLALFLFSAIATVLYFRRFDKFELLEYKDTALNGGMMGFISFIGFTASFIPLVLILSLFIKSYYNYGLPYFLNLNALWLFVLVIITTAIICAVTNGVMLMGLQLIDNLRRVK